MQKNSNIVLISIIFAFGLPLNAKIFFVDDNASGGGDGTLWVNAFNYLQDALSVVSSGDEIWVAEGIYKPDDGTLQQNGDRLASFNLVNGVGLYGGFKGSETKREPIGDFNQTILSGEIDVNSTDWSMHVLYALGLDSSSIIKGFRIINGYADGSEPPQNQGGGMYNQNASPTIENCSFIGNTAKSQGGAVYNVSSSPSFINCEFSNNVAGVSGVNGYGGAMYNSSSSPTLRNCFFSDNNASYQGGGLWGIQSNGIISNSIFSGNNATGNGGGFYLTNSSPSFINCVFEKNSGDYGGGGYQQNSSPIFYNSLFYNNNAIYRGGGLFFYKSNAILNNCNIVSNSAGSTGGGLGISTLSSLSPTLNNSIVWKNLSNNSEGHGITGDWIGSSVSPSILQGWTGEDRAISNDPFFSNFPDPDGPDNIWFTSDDGLRLLQGSPTIDYGGETLSPPRYDLAGFVRVQNEKIDLGAYEFGDQLLVLHSVSLFSNPLGSGVFTGGGTVEENSTQSISAIPQLGFLFQGWAGDLNGTENPKFIIVDQDKNITANFTKDLNDTDGDGLTNFDELVRHGTKVDSNDTDSDTMSDLEEVNIGSDPRVSDLHIIDFLSVDVVKSIALAKSEGNASGVAYVLANPGVYNLHTALDYNISVQNSYDNGRATGLAEGQNLVTSNPLSYHLIEKSIYDQVAEELRIYKMVYVWEDYDDFSQGTLSANQWRLGWWKGSQPPSILNGRMRLSGTGLLHSPSSENPNGSDAYVSKLLRGSVEEAPRMNSFAEVMGEGVYGVEGRIQLPKGSPLGGGVRLSAVQYNSDGTQNNFGVELCYRNQSSSKPDLKFNYTDPTSGEKIIIDREGEFNVHYRVSVIHTFEKNIVYLNDELIFKFAPNWTPNWFGFNGFMEKESTWAPYGVYVDDVRVLRPPPISVSPTTPYTEGWFFVPDHGWLYTSRTIYPYFFDGATNGWMYFLSGYELPRFYHYGTKSWIDWASFTEGIIVEPTPGGGQVEKKEEPLFIQLSAINNSFKTHYAESAANLEMMWIEPGSFLMGSSEDEANHAVNEMQHDVNLTNGFYLGKYEVTQSQYEVVMNGNPGGVSSTPSQYPGTARPVEKISWDEAILFCTRLTEFEQSLGRLPQGWKYTLPTESEWEYVCRAGTNSSYSWGESISSTNANFLKNIAQTSDVGQYPSNPWGFFDMNGNVWEWTADWYDANYKTSLGSDLLETEVTSTKSARGGSWSDIQKDLRSASRIGIGPAGRYDILGFRIALKGI